MNYKHRESLVWRFRKYHLFCLKVIISKIIIFICFLSTYQVNYVMEFLLISEFNIEPYL